MMFFKLIILFFLLLPHNYYFPLLLFHKSFFHVLPIFVETPIAYIVVAKHKKDFIFSLLSILKVFIELLLDARLHFKQ